MNITETAEMALPSKALNAFIPEKVDLDKREEGFVQARYGFEIGGLSLLIPLQSGSEIILKPALYSIPNTPEPFQGVCNIRGSIVPVYDLFDAFHIQKSGSRYEQILVLGEGEQMVGIMVEQLPTVVHVTQDARKINELQPLPDNLSRFVSGGYVVDEVNWHEVDFVQLIYSLSGNS